MDDILEAIEASGDHGETAPAIVQCFRHLHAECARILEESLQSPRDIRMASSRQLRLEIDAWQQVIACRRESELLRRSGQEVDFALLALAQGQYRHAFKSLRLVLELCLQTVALSANELHSRQWLANARDTSWSKIVDADRGIFSDRFAEAFFPSLKPHIRHFLELAKSVYRECSECVHGNTPESIPLDGSLAFSPDLFELWHSKAEVVARLVNFALCLRYLEELDEKAVTKLEPGLSPRLGHIPEIRKRLGGTIS